MTLASILRVSGGTDLVNQLTLLPMLRSRSGNPQPHSLPFTNSTVTLDPFRERKR